MSISEISQEFKCKCGEATAWITEGKVTEPCPVCYRRYKGIYNPDTLHIEGAEVLDCQACGKFLEPQEMYSVDACSEQCQNILFDKMKNEKV